MGKPPPLFGQCPKENVFFEMMSPLLSGKSCDSVDSCETGDCGESGDLSESGNSGETGD